MSKVILVLDEMPETCNECELHLMDECSERFECYVGGGVFCWDEEVPRPDSCPLKKLPEHPPFVVGDTFDYGDGYADGWHDCLKEIEGVK